MKNYLACEYIEQDEYGKYLFSDSLNTIRILTMKNPYNKKTFIAIAVQRIGTNKSKPVDNWTSGGLSAKINLETGELSKAVSHLKDNTLSWFSNHPDTGNRIKGKVVPNWDSVKRKVLELSNRLPYLDYIGWDVVPLDDGIIVIEANNHSDVNLLQVHEPLLKDERVRKFYTYHRILTQTIF